MMSGSTGTKRHITFGLCLDGQRAVTPASSLGQTTVGPLGLLEILETQLGLTATCPSAAERTVQYRDCLAMCDDYSRFYHRSFALDPLGTAACLLGWRDEWALHQHGHTQWDVALRPGAPSRLQDLAAVEQRALKAVAPNVAQRLQAIEAGLRIRKPDIEAIRLLEPIEVFPLRWQAVLRALPVFQDAPTPAMGRGFLGRLQRQLAKAALGECPERLCWQDDGTVVLVQAETHILAAQWVAGRLATPGTLLVAGADGALLDAHLAATGQARRGLKELSALRPSMQMLPLVTELLWSPLNCYALVQFLTHPVCPLPEFASHSLARKMAAAPGIGGEKWQRALASITSQAGPERAAAVAADIAFWVEHLRFDPAVGAPLTVVTERIGRLLDVFRRRLGDANEALSIGSGAGYAQCQACLSALNALIDQGHTVIRPRQLQKLVDQASGAGAPNLLWPAEVGAGPLVSQPGAVFEPTPRVIWWQLTLPELPSPLPWSGAEVRALQQAGVCLPDPAQQLEQIARNWLRPVMAACDQLILVLPPTDEEVHPLWRMMTAVVDSPNVMVLEDLLGSGSEGMHAITPLALATPSRWWQLQADVNVALRSTESFSSLELLLFNPYQWLLRYPAALRPSNLISLGNDFLLLGNLAHALIERYFRREDALATPGELFETWFGRTFETLIDHEGALLRMPGRGADLALFRNRLRHALLTLRAHVRQASGVAVMPELALEGRFEGGALVGFADLVVHKAVGTPVIVDMKWTGAQKYPQKLKNNRHLQLVIYAELLRQQTGQWPSVAYYLLDRAWMLAPDDRGFPETEVVPPGDGENTAQLWMRFLETWRWRRAQIEAGRFEVVLEATDPTTESVPPESAMTIETLNEAYNGYRALAGWSKR